MNNRIGELITRLTLLSRNRQFGIGNENRGQIQIPKIESNVMADRCSPLAETLNLLTQYKLEFFYIFKISFL